MNPRIFLKKRLENRAASISCKKKIVPVMFWKTSFDGPSQTDGETIYLKPPKSLSTNDIAEAYSNTLHEGAHIRYSSTKTFGPLHRLVSNKHYDAKLFFDTFNVIEDFRVNTLLSVEFPGAGHLVHRVHQRLVDDLLIDTPNMALYCNIHGYNYKHSPKVNNKKLEKATKVARESPFVDTPKLISITEEVYNILHDGAKCSSDKEPNNPYDFGGVRQNNPSSMPMNDSDAESNTKKTQKKMKSREIPAFTKDDSKDDSTMNDLESMASDIRDIELKEMKKKSITKLRSHAIDVKTRAKVDIKTIFPDLSFPDKYIRDVNYLSMTIKTLRRNLSKIIEFERGYTSGMKNGKLDSRRVHRLATGETSNVFKKKSSFKNIGGIAIMLVIDCSGSMSSNSKMKLARESAIIFHETLRKLNIMHSILGYTADIHRRPSAQTYLYKDWSQTDPCYELSYMIPHNNNRDGDSLRHCKQYFKGVHEERKIMIVISDGYPSAYEYSGSPAIADTIMAQHEITKAGIKLINIGVGYKMPNKYINSITINRVSDLPKKITRILKKEL